MSAGFFPLLASSQTTDRGAASQQAAAGALTAQASSPLVFPVAVSRIAVPSTAAVATQARKIQATSLTPVAIFKGLIESKKIVEEFKGKSIPRPRVQEALDELQAIALRNYRDAYVSRVIASVDIRESITAQVLMIERLKNQYLNLIAPRPRFTDRGTRAVASNQLTPAQQRGVAGNFDEGTAVQRLLRRPLAAAQNATSARHFGH